MNGNNNNTIKLLLLGTLAGKKENYAMKEIME